MPLAPPAHARCQALRISRIRPEVLLAALAARIDLDADVDPADLDTARRLGLA